MRAAREAVGLHRSMELGLVIDRGCMGEVLG